ncbi:MAG TPA: glycoside hydrolase family 2 TIM barrel-domain containing protein, partial [Niabella sp.]|nr:glycoside hydrolase family 2 TIM barrel-domain containing protein [Niabella sp.]
MKAFTIIDVSWIGAYKSKLVVSSITMLVIIGSFLLSGDALGQPLANRMAIDLNSNWRTIAGNDENPVAPAFQTNFDDSKWKQVNVPHNWDDYHGYRRLLHGNKHGDAWYRRTVKLKQSKAGKRFFLFFEGVGSYATVYLNGQEVGVHAGGRTTFTIDITNYIKTDGTNNLLAVRAWHPPFIKDLPWVCGGCSDERGFSEGSQPMGIFRPVQLIVTNDLRIEPFGVHAWATLKGNAAVLNINTNIKNYGTQPKSFTVVHNLVDKKGTIINTVTEKGSLKANSNFEFSIKNIDINKVNLWSVEDPYLYKIVSIIKAGSREVDRLETDFGFRTVNWKTATNQFYLNDKPVFINGVAEYEHLIGQSHAFSKEQVIARIKWMEAAGFNAFRDGHQPHNLLYGKLFNQKGILWWTQLSAHVWYDTPEFKANFKQLLKEWVIERRNDPSVVLWGLQNESKIPEAFAKECTQLIRDLDPTSASQRLVTTCNGGEGTDWDVPQNWTGTYGGNPDTYGEDLKKQVLVGEY